MTKVTAQMSISLDGCYAGARHDDPATWMDSEEAAGFFRVTRWVIDAMAWRDRLGVTGGEASVHSDIIEELRGGGRVRHGATHGRWRRGAVGRRAAVPRAGVRRDEPRARDAVPAGRHDASRT